MKQHLERIPPSMSQFIKFCMVGVCNTVLDFLSYILLTRVFGIFYLLANVFSFIISSTNSYFLNRHFTFKGRGEKKKKEYLKFMGVMLVGLALGQGVLFVSVHFLGLNDLFGKVIGVVVGIFWNYFGSKRVVFAI